jgi:hypothetical protein
MRIVPNYAHIKHGYQHKNNPRQLEKLEIITADSFSTKTCTPDDGQLG